MARRIKMAQIGQWARECKRAQRSIFQSSAQKLGNDVTKTVNEGGLLPIKTGNLRSSFKSSTASMVQLDRSNVEYSQEDWQLGILGADVGDTLYLGFRAVYAARQNYGFVGQDSLGRTFNQSGKYFVEGSAARWQQFVKEAEREHAVK